MIIDGNKRPGQAKAYKTKLELEQSREIDILNAKIKEAESMIKLAIDESKCSCFPHSVMCVHCRLKGYMNKYRRNDE